MQNVFRRAGWALGAQRAQHECERQEEKEKKEKKDKEEALLPCLGSDMLTLAFHACLCTSCLQDGDKKDKKEKKDGFVWQPLTQAPRSPRPRHAMLVIQFARQDKKAKK